MGLLEKIIPPAKPGRFAQKVQQRIRQQLPGVTCEYDADAFELHLSNGHHINLANFYHHYCVAPLTQRKVAIGRVLSLLNEVSGDRDEPLRLDPIRGKLLPRLRSEAYVDLTTLALSDAGDDNPDAKPFSLVTRPIAPGLVAEIVIDNETSVMSLTQTQLDELGTTFDALWPTARDNLYKLSVGRFQEISPGLFASPFGDSHDASRAIMPDLFRDLPIRGRLLFAAPTPEVLLLCGDEDPSDVVQLAELSFKIQQEGGRPLTGQIYQLDEHDRWQPLKLPRSHPAFWRVRRNAGFELAGAYADQQQVLVQQHAKEGRDCFVAELSLSGYEDSPEVYTYAIWPAEVTDMLLPRADVYALVEAKDKPIRRVLFDDVLRVCPHRLTVTTDRGLVRYHITTFPTSDEIAAMNPCAGDDIRAALLSRIS